MDTTTRPLGPTEASTFVVLVAIALAALAFAMASAPWAVTATIILAVLAVYLVRDLRTGGS